MTIQLLKEGGRHSYGYKTIGLCAQKAALMSNFGLTFAQLFKVFPMVLLRTQSDLTPFLAKDVDFGLRKTLAYVFLPKNHRAKALQQICRHSKKKQMLKQINKAKKRLKNIKQKTKAQSTPQASIVLTKARHHHLHTSLKQRYVQKTSQCQNRINPFINTPKYTNDPFLYASRKTQSRSKFIQLLKQMIDSKIHLGHLEKRTHPSMRHYIYGTIKTFVIFDLVYTAHQLNRSLTYLTKAVQQRKTVLFIANKEHLKYYISCAATLSTFYFVNAKWRGGLITNWKDMSNSLIKLKHFELSIQKDSLKYLPKKEISYLTKRNEKLYGHLKGLRKLLPLKKTKSKMPGVVIVFGQRENRTALREIQKKGLRNILILDINGNLKQGDDFVIPSNDTSTQSVRFFLDSFLMAIDQGRKRRVSRMLIKKLVITRAQVSKAHQFWKFYYKNRKKKGFIRFVQKKGGFKQGLIKQYLSQFKRKHQLGLKLTNKLKKLDQFCLKLFNMCMGLLSQKYSHPIQQSEFILTPLKKNKPKLKVNKSQILDQSKKLVNQSKKIINNSVTDLTPFEQSTKLTKNPRFTSKHYCCSINTRVTWTPQRRFVKVYPFYKINYNNLTGTYQNFVELYKIIKKIKYNTRNCLISLIPLVTHENISSKKFTFNLLVFSMYCHKILKIKRVGSFLNKPINLDKLKRLKDRFKYLISKGLKPGQPLPPKPRRPPVPRSLRRQLPTSWSKTPFSCYPKGVTTSKGKTKHPSLVTPKGLLRAKAKQKHLAQKDQYSKAQH